jgi:hypothetical protein
MLPIVRGSISVMTAKGPTIWLATPVTYPKTPIHHRNSVHDTYRLVRDPPFTHRRLPSSCVHHLRPAFSPYVFLQSDLECASFLNSPPNVPPPPSSLLRHGSLPYQSGLCITLRPFSISRYAIDLVQGGLFQARFGKHWTNLDRPIFSLSKVGFMKWDPPQPLP